MPKKEKILTEELIIEEIIQFRQKQKTLVLATQSLTDAKKIEPLASYAPFVEDDEGNFYLFLSSLASHSANLNEHQEAHTRISILLIEDEQSTRNIFARKRLSYSCGVSIWSRTHPRWQEIINQLQIRFGKTIEVLAGLGDFNLYCLTPIDGNYVRGFGQAYELKEGHMPVLRNS